MSDCIIKEEDKWEYADTILRLVRQMVKAGLIDKQELADIAYE